MVPSQCRVVMQLLFDVVHRQSRTCPFNASYDKRRKFSSVKGFDDYRNVLAAMLTDLALIGAVYNEVFYSQPLKYRYWPEGLSLFDLAEIRSVDVPEHNWISKRSPHGQAPAQFGRAQARQRSLPAMHRAGQRACTADDGIRALRHDRAKSPMRLRRGACSFMINAERDNF